MKKSFCPSAFLGLLLVGCAVGPDYVRPSAPTPAAYKEQSDLWKPAQPQDLAERGPWWTVYNDPLLNELEAQIDVSNQTIKAAAAAYRASQAAVVESQAALFPTLSLNGSLTRSGSLGTPLGASSSGSTTQNTYSAAANANWNIDLWGRLRRTVESDKANAEASAADLAAARLSMQAELATAYFNLRAQDSLKDLLESSIKAFKSSLDIVKNQYEAGLVSMADVFSAQTQLESTQAQAINVGVLRAQLEHAIAVLTGKPPAVFSLPPLPLSASVPNIPAETPTMLLERRPDIAAAERQMATANAQIGVETAAFFPNLTLSASVGTTATAISKLFQASSSLWSLGPALAETVFDAGARSARIDQARATYDQTVANYRQTVLTAFQQVEDQLAALRILAEQARATDAVVESARKAERLVLNQYKAGIVPYSSVLTAQTSRFDNERSSLAAKQNRIAASIALIQALGGGWERDQLPTTAKIK